MGDCVVSCEFDAIHVIDGVARVDYRNCTGCGACIDACPRHIISRIPFKAENVMIVGCSNQDFGLDVKKVCTIGCIGCKACTKFETPIEMDGHLPKVDYEAYEPVETSFHESIEKCPMESLVFVGTPSQAEILATIDEDLPQRVEADFRSTVDQAEWRG